MRFAPGCGCCGPFACGTNCGETVDWTFGSISAGAGAAACHIWGIQCSNVLCLREYGCTTQDPAIYGNPFCNGGFPLPCGDFDYSVTDEMGGAVTLNMAMHGTKCYSQIFKVITGVAANENPPQNPP